MSEALNDAITSSSAQSQGGRIAKPNVSSSFKMPDKTSMDAPTLRVRDLGKMLSFYEGAFGLHLISKKKENGKGIEIVELGINNDGKSGPLLILRHDPNARQPQRDFAGLFHYAVLVPNRKSLARAFLALQKNAVRFDGFADHLVSESLYLHDPESNGIEIYRDKPRNEWTYDKEGRILMDTLPLDLAGILGELSPEEALIETEAFPDGARIGHMHLRVTNLERSSDFYTRVLGFHVSADWSAMGAMFLAAGGYHHHLGLNTWHSLNGTQHEQGEAGLEAFTIKVPQDARLMQQLRSRIGSRLTKQSDYEILFSDPDGIPILVKLV
jgi:catechol 2,3-dioxygenase